MPRRKKGKTKLLVSFILDQTGSMGVCRDATIDGFNEYIATLASKADEVLFGLTLFNSEAVDVRCVDTPVGDVPKLTVDTYRPDSTTPLYDAIGRTVRAVEAQVAAMEDKPGGVLVVIMTDGLENASREYTQNAIFQLIKAKEAEGWTFAYLGANQDAWVTGATMGISQGNTMGYDGDPGGTKVAMDALSQASVNYTSRGGQAGKAGFFGGSRTAEEYEKHQS